MQRIRCVHQTLCARVALASLALAVVVAACSTEPTGVPPQYKLVASDSLWTSSLSCFASSTDYGASQQDSCSVALRGLTAYFDSSGSQPFLVLDASVRTKAGDTTWHLHIPAKIQDRALVYGDGPGYPTTTEEWFITPQSGSLVGGALALQMFSYTSLVNSGERSYRRPAGTVYLLTQLGLHPSVGTLRSSYVGTSFAGFGPAHCAVQGGGTVCQEQTFTLDRTGVTWKLAYGVKSSFDSTEFSSGGITLDSVPVAVRGPAVRFELPSGGFPSGGGSPFTLQASGSLIGDTLTLFPFVELLDGVNIPSPIILEPR